jgi:5-methylcytosine-specific restriction enzyme subunit McrC
MDNPEIIFITEQKSSLIPALSESDATALEELGRELRGASRSWGNEGDFLQGLDGPHLSGGVIKVEKRPGEIGWRVLVSNAIGIIGVGDLQIMVMPKIPTNHFGYLASYAIDPAWLRLGNGQFQVEEDSGFLPSVWIAFLDALSVSLKADLHHDYVEMHDDPPYVRGGLDIRRTSVNLARGKLAFPAWYEELSVNNPINRVLRAASSFVEREASRIMEGLVVDEKFRQRAIYRLIADRARDAVYQLMQAGDLLSDDLTAEVSRLAVHQQRAFELARHILSGVGRTMMVGDKKVSCYLYATPPMIESGVRNLLNTHLSAEVSVTKQSRTAAKLRFNPDLVVEPIGLTPYGVFATGDVKYRIRNEDWPRDILEQAVVFAEVFNADQGFFIDFELGEDQPSTKSEQIDSKRYHRISWPAREGIAPDHSAQYILSECRKVLFEKT